MASEAEILTAHAAYCRAVAALKVAQDAESRAKQASTAATEALGVAGRNVEACKMRLLGLTATTEPVTVQPVPPPKPEPLKTVTFTKEAGQINPPPKAAKARG